MVRFFSNKDNSDKEILKYNFVNYVPIANILKRHSKMNGKIFFLLGTFLIGTGILTLSVIPNDCTIIIPSQNATGDGNGVSSELGIILAILAGGINAIGLNFQKLGHNSSPEDTLQYLKSRIWWIGFLFIIVAELVGSIAYGFSPASIVSALGATTVFFNSIISILFLKEKVSRKY